MSGKLSHNQKSILAAGAKKSVGEVTEFYTKVDKEFRDVLRGQGAGEYKVKILKNRPSTGDHPKFISPVSSLCVPGDMSKCSEQIWDRQCSCFFGEEATGSPRCMYFVFDEYCDCNEAQRAAVGQPVDLKKFKEDKKLRSAMGDTSIWDEKKILAEIDKLFDVKKLKYDDMPIEVLQERVENSKLYYDSYRNRYIDTEWEVVYSANGVFLEKVNRERIEKNIRKEHDIRIKYNLECDAEVEELLIEDVLNHEFDDYMTSLEEPSDFITDVDVVELHKVDGIYYDNDKKIYIVKSTGGMYEHRLHTNVWDLVGKQ